MTLLTGDLAKIAIGIFAVLAGVTNMIAALRHGYIPYTSGGLDRAERPLSFWSMIGVYVAVIVFGLDLLVSGIAHVHTFWG